MFTQNRNFELRSGSLAMTKSRRSSRQKSKQRRGAMLVLICVMIFAFLVTVALSVDIAYMQLVKSELRAASDAAARAAAQTLAKTQDVNAAIARGKAIALEIKVANKGLRLKDSDLVFGSSRLSSSGRFEFTPGGSHINSVRVNGQRTNGSLSGNVPLFFGQIFDFSSFQPEAFCTATFIQRDIVLVVDRSGSMNDFNKFNDLREAVRVFISILADSPVDERVGLASYSTTASEDVQLTEDLNLIDVAMARMPVSGYTNIAGGMDAGGKIMARGRSVDFVERTMIVLTDGIKNRGREVRDAAIDEAANGTTIHAITFGLDADRSRMQEAAQIGGGRYFHADDGVQLKNVFEEIALTLSTIITE